MSMSIGKFVAKEVVDKCKQCKKIYRSTDLTCLAPKQSKYCYDVIAYIGESMFVRYKTNEEIKQDLENYNVQISSSEIEYLGKKFIIYLALAHKQSEKKLKKFIQSHGGYILHTDGTCESDSLHLMSFIDEISDIVLGNIKISSEKSEYIIPFLEELKETYGSPIACVHDMSRGIIKAIETVFPGVKDFICHYHFLRDIGKDLFESSYKDFINYLKDHKVYKEVKSALKKLNIKLMESQELKDELEDYLQRDNNERHGGRLKPEIKLFLLLSWVHDAKSQCNGYGFPFDRQHLEFYNRFKSCCSEIENLLSVDANKKCRTLLKVITRTLNDISLNGLADILSERINVFDELRSAMRIATPDAKNGLNDEGDTDIETIKENVTEFVKSEKMMQLAATDLCYRKMIKQIKKYWDKLFSDPIKIETPKGSINRNFNRPKF